MSVISMLQSNKTDLKNYARIFKEWRDFCLKYYISEQLLRIIPAIFQPIGGLFFNQPLSKEQIVFSFLEIVKIKP